MNSHSYGLTSHHHDSDAITCTNPVAAYLSGTPDHQSGHLRMFGAKLRDVFARISPRASHQPAALCLGGQSRYFFSSPLISFIYKANYMGICILCQVEVQIFPAYSTIANTTTMQTTLIIIDTELIALANPISPFNSAVNAGAAEPIGLNTKSASAWRYSNSSGSR